MSIAQNLEIIAENVPKVYESGKQKERTVFWNYFQDYGNRTEYDSAFKHWKSEYIEPEYKIVFTKRMHYLFQFCTKLKKIERKYFEFSTYTPTQDTAVTAWYYTFNHCEELEYFEDLGLQAGGYYYTWAYNMKLHTIEIMRCREDSICFGAFVNCLALVNITIDGVIGQNFDIHWSPLSVASLKDIITHLKDYSGTSSEYTCTVSFKATAFAELEAEGATSPHGNTWEEYIDDLKWKLTKV